MELTKRLWRIAKKFPDKMAIWVEGRSYTYQMLWSGAIKIAHLFVTYSKKPSYCIVFCERTFFAYQCILGAFLSGKTYVPIDIHLPISRSLKQIIKINPEIMCIDLREKDKMTELLNQLPAMLVCVADKESRETLSQLIPKHSYITPSLNACAKDFSSLPFISSRRMAYLLFTSGSTGEPKGISIQYRQLNDYINSLSRIGCFHVRDRFSHCIEFTFDLSLHEMLLCWTAGARLYVFPGYSFLSIKTFIRNHRITRWISVPSHITLLFQLKKLTPSSFPSLRTSFFCGETLFQSQVEQWKSAAPHSEIINMYGPTEATIALTYFKWRNHLLTEKDKTIPIGFPFFGQSICLIDQFGNLSTEGELCLSGRQVISHYWQHSQEHEKSFQYFDWDKSHRRWYRTGDLAYYDKKYGYIFKGRKDDQWKIRGHRIEKLEIENELRRLAGSFEVAVIPVKSQSEGIKGFKACVGKEIDPFVLMKKARQELPSVMVPEKVILLESLPRNSNGKIDYKLMEEKYA